MATAPNGTCPIPPPHVAYTPNSVQQVECMILLPALVIKTTPEAILSHNHVVQWGQVVETMVSTIFSQSNTVLTTHISIHMGVPVVVKGLGSDMIHNVIWLIKCIMPQRPRNPHNYRIHYITR